MASRPVIIASLIGASVGVPYLASQARHGAPSNAPLALPANSPSSQPIAAGSASLPVITFLPSVGSPPTAAVTSTLATPPPQDGARFTSVEQVLRFDVTKDWVCRNWPRKSTGPTDVGLFAMRVPLVMGTQLSALAGALTYYFNAQGQVEHISFRGRTGDTTPLVQLLTRSYQFQSVAAPTGEKVFQVASGDAVQSELRLRPEAVLQSSSPQQSVAVELEFARPGSQRVLPPRGLTLQVPPMETSPAVAAPQPPASSTSNALSGGTATSAAPGTGYFDRVRYASPTEESQLLWKRWPH